MCIRDRYVANEKIDGIINALGAGVPSRFTTINAKSDSDSLVIGVKQIYQGAWNPIGGFSDVYSNQIWLNLYDPGVFSHPFTGKIIPIRTEWQVENFGKDQKYRSLKTQSSGILRLKNGKALELTLMQ